MKQESTFSTKELTALNKRCMKKRAKNIAVARQEYSISEEYEYSHEKPERVSLLHKNARIQFIQNITKHEQKHTDAPSKALKTM